MSPFLFLPFALSFLFYHAAAQVAIPRFIDCFSGNPSLKLNITTVYAQITTSESLSKHLNITLLGQSPQIIQGTANGSSDLATLFSTTEILTFSIRDNTSFFCETLRPPSPLPAQANSTGLYCPIPAGPFAFSTYVPLSTSRELATLQTRLRAVDPFSNELLCVNVATTPLHPGALGSVYGHARFIFYGTVALCAAYWLLVAVARLASAWTRRSGWSGRGFWARVENVGSVVASAISGEGLSKSPALIRFGTFFLHLTPLMDERVLIQPSSVPHPKIKPSSIPSVTPSMRDIFFHTQWCAALSMVAVQWPEFIYPLLTQTAWATLSYNVTLTQGSDKHWNPVSTPTFHPPSNFADQLSEPSSPIFIDSSVSNTLFTLPQNATPGLSSFAYAVGLRPQDLFPVCLILFLSIVAATIVLSLLLWMLDSMLTFAVNTFSNGRPKNRYGPTRSPRYSATGKDIMDGMQGVQSTTDEERSHSSHLLKTSKLSQIPRKSWFRFRVDFSSLHFSVLQGNLVRILMLFHLPVTIFSSYQLAIGHGQASALSMALAALSFAVFSVIIPILFILRLFMTSTSKLYDETWTLLALGPLYNHYRHGSQLFACMFFATSLTLGLTIGCGQKSAIAQSVIILLIEVVSALVTSIWLPWGHGASMGLISFLFCVARIVVAVLLVILTPTVSIGIDAGQWVTYVILLIILIVYLALVLLLASKVIEAATRIIGGVGFDHSRHTVDSGLIGVCGLVGCCGSRKQPSPRHRAKHSDLPPIVSQTTLPLSGRVGSTHTQSAPPSVFRPEHALRPYREENDDDSGYIMGAWRPFPRSGYNSVGDHGTPPESPGKTGFSRVGGGRSHFDAPYSITTGSVHTFPLTPSEQPPTPHRHSYESNPSVNASFTNAERQPYSSLPPGAMAPHVRRKSQSAIIEHVPAPASPKAAVVSSSQLAASRVPSAFRRHSHLSEVVSPASDDDDASAADQPRKRHWFQLQLRKPRRHSEGDETRLAGVALTEKSGDGGGRSFAVLRGRKSAQPVASGSASGSGGPSAATPARSFVVLRGKDCNNSPA
ncbi:hypothetical protein F5148DRAFT_277574 [Russula earlei]|uniref:Uncharacterized protein n=1 Tax=Russula earlei TaxID=71964 RepID=A0ACC0UPC6_9AGAM|nr:hypothetical protein F5148DRAFT_277574 [Russula earlei]